MCYARSRRAKPGRKATLVPPESAPLDGKLLSLQEAADRLRVHYMTAYRWVRQGDLPAFKAGGRLRVRLSDLERFLGDRAVDVTLPAAAPGRTDWTAHVWRLQHLVCEGRGVEAAALVRKVIADGASAGDVYLQLLTPVLHRIGHAWSEGDLTVAEEHRATEICGAIMARSREFFRRRGPRRGAAVTLTPPQERHGLAAAMVADFLRAGGYDVHHLGADVPVPDLQRFLQTVSVEVICISVTRTDHDAGIYDRLVNAAGANGDTPLLVFGGQGADANAARRTGGIFVGDLALLTDVVDRCLRG